MWASSTRLMLTPAGLRVLKFIAAWVTPKTPVILPLLREQNREILSPAWKGGLPTSNALAGRRRRDRRHGSGRLPRQLPQRRSRRRHCRREALGCTVFHAGTRLADGPV